MSNENQGCGVITRGQKRKASYAFTTLDNENNTLNPKKLRSTNVITKDLHLPSTPKSAIQHFQDPRSPSLQTHLVNRYKQIEERVDEPQACASSARSLASLFGSRIFENSAYHAQTGSLILHTQTSSELNILTPVKMSKNAAFTIETISYDFQAVDIIVNQRVTKYHTGSVVHYVPGIHTYDKIAKKLQALATKFGGDKKVANAIWDMVHDKQSDIFKDITHQEAEKHNKFLAKVAYLLFVTEPTRDVASLIINSMFLELTLNGQSELSEIVKLPMSAKKATSEARKLQDISNLSQEKPIDINTTKIATMLDQYNEIFYKWLAYKKVSHLTIEDHSDLIASIINDSIKEWFGVEIKPFKSRENAVMNLSFGAATQDDDLGDMMEDFFGTQSLGDSMDT
ncbi:MAG UNVERIFIED_CONTAM: hypothetical protein LVQ98_03800 [Rickettsiaceae bacterium]|jgi:hypothetical protein